MQKKADATHINFEPKANDQPKPKGESSDLSAQLTFPIVSGVIASLIVAVILSKHIGRFFQRVGQWVKPSTRLLHQDFLSEIERSKEFFIPNLFEVFNKHGIAIDISKTEHTEEVDLFIDRILLDPSSSFYLLLAPTGVGKTTFLSQVFLSYKKRSGWSGQPMLYLGKVHHSRTLEELDKILKSGEAENSILLLDALDEFKIRRNENPENYWQLFYQLWEEKLLHERLSKFKKVIVSVREQFFNSSDLEDITINDIDIRKIRLMPFSEEAQRKSYLQKRFAGTESDEIMRRDGIIILVEKLHEKGLLFVEKPLILNFMEDVWTAFQTHYRTAHNYEFFSNEFIYRVIIDKWFEREGKSSDGASALDKARMERYCKLLAWQISSNGQHSMSGEQLLEMERVLNTISDLKGVQGRSLLIRVDDARDSQRAGNLLDNFKFIHESFLEFFLFMHLLEHPELEHEFNFERYSFTLQLLVGHRWRSVKSSVVPHFAGASDGNDMIEPTKAELSAVAMPLLTLVGNIDFCTKMFEKGQMQELLSKEDPNWTYQLRTETVLIITNESFWDFQTHTPDPVSHTAIILLKPAIGAVQFSGIVIQDEMLSCFEGCDQIVQIEISRSDLEGHGLAFFSSCAINLQILQLSFNMLEDKYLEVFRGAESLRYLNLDRNRFNGSCLRNFVGLNLEHLDLSYNEITDDNLKLLGSCPNLKSINLHLNELEGHGFDIFESTTELEWLTLGSNRLTDDCLRYFSRNLDLTALYLNENQFNGSGFVYLKNAKSLDTLSLSDNPIDSQYLIHFRNLDKLNYLELGNIRLGDGLKYFTNSYLLEDIRLYNTGITDQDLQSLVFGNKLKRIDFSGNALTGEVFDIFRGKLEFLERLDINDNQIGSSLPDIFKDSHHINEVNLSNTQINPGHLNYFSHCAATLTRLYMSNLNLQDNDLSVFGGFQQLKDLNLSGNRFTGSFLIQLKHLATELEELNLANNQLNDQNLYYLEAFSSLNTLNLSQNLVEGDGLINLRTSASVLEVLNLSGNSISDDDLQFLEHARFLKEVRLADNKFNGSCVKFLLNSAATLETLILSGNPIVPEELLIVGEFTELEDTDITQWIQFVEEE
ncbi:hypothetical protein PBAL39_12805 [Pedobacter sp. BAL39]|uniref:leucine-rich repeat protein n=1 Tax=Pedobacter sp. BAL39 TaxID=391596 RepID=UPI0001559235|nr:leucine-rich repeat protein [Pedobacter sp. BAL39]EDM35349.1 hypothetical protein PBAL39_12805 [Pedobacter sp. BAL39]